MLQLLPCPHCGQQSLLPHETSLEASLKCPHCGQQLVLGEALLQQFSSWEVVDDPAELAPSQDASSQLSQPIVIPVPQTESPHEELHLADAHGAVANTPASKVSVRPYTHFEYERLRRKKKSPIWSVVPVVLGGLAAFPIALLILWHALGKDVGDMGPKVAEYAPWIVPKQFHPVSKQSLSKQSSQPSPRQPPQPGQSGLPQLGDLAPKPTLAPNLLEAEGSVEANATAMKQSADKTETTTEAPTKPISDQPALAVKASGLASERSTTLGRATPNENLFATIRETKDQLVQLEKAMESASPDRIKLLTSVYERLAQLAVVFSSIDKDNSVQRTIREQMQPIARAIKQNSEIQAVLDKFLEKKVGQAPADEPAGIAMTLVITGVEQLQELWMVAGNHQLAPNTIIEVPRTLSPALVAGQKLLVLGVLVPADSIEAGGAPILRVSYLHAL